jgi:hypothetical protein
MTPPFPRPGYIPEPAWSIYLEWIEPDPYRPGVPWLLRPPYDARIRRLFGVHPDAPKDRTGQPEIARTWRHLATAIDPPDRPNPWSRSDWRHLLDLLVNLPEAFDGGAHRATRRARELAPQIAAQARALADALSELRDLASDHPDVDAPPALGCTWQLILSAANAETDPHARYRFDRDVRPYAGQSVYERLDVQHLPTPAALLSALADEIDAEAPAPGARQAPGMAAPLVWDFDAAWAIRQGADDPDIPPRGTMEARFRIDDTDLARLLTAMHGVTVTRHDANKARAKRTEKPAP